MTSIDTHNAKSITIRNSHEIREHDGSHYEVIDITITDTDDKTVNMTIFSDNGRVSFDCRLDAEKPLISDEDVSIE